MDRDDLEPRVRHVLERKLVRRATGPYSARTDAQVDAALRRLFAAEGLRDVRIDGLRRMAGGASKEQFAFTLRHAGASEPERLVLRMDPLESIAETCRLREAQILRAMDGVVPVPRVRFVDPEGEHLGHPGLITSFVAGVTKPTDLVSATVSGVGTRYGPHWVSRLAPQFLKYLVAIHDFDWRRASLDDFAAPRAGSRDAALRQVNWWARVWRDDVTEPVPLVTWTERWLREHAPLCAQPVVVHGDYRIGNFMFVEPSGDFSAVLDWELAHLGDFHADLGWVVQKLFGGWDDAGRFLVCGLMSREEFLERYEKLSGRTIDPETLRYYEVMSAWKCAVMNLGPAIRAPLAGNNHQDLLLTWLATAASVFLQDIVALVRRR
jgi:aminoglycoside phosphotransferase (APT) family kinase protein